MGPFTAGGNVARGQGRDDKGGDKWDGVRSDGLEERSRDRVKGTGGWPVR